MITQVRWVHGTEEGSDDQFGFWQYVGKKSGRPFVLAYVTKEPGDEEWYWEAWRPDNTTPDFDWAGSVSTLSQAKKQVEDLY